MKNINTDNEEYEYLDFVTFHEVRAMIQLMQYKYDTKTILACIYDLYQEYLISDSQEAELYELADPDDEYNEPSKYWRELEIENPLLEICGAKPFQKKEAV